MPAWYARGFRQLNLVLVSWLYWGGQLPWATGYHSAFINVTVQEPGQGTPRTFLIGQARYGLDSPPVEVKGWVLTPQPRREGWNLQGCDPETQFQVPPDFKQWIALLQRGNCTFKEKISRAASHRAVAAVIYNNNEEVITMTHQGTGNIVVVMIPKSEGEDILNYLQKNASVQMTITPRTSVVHLKRSRWAPVVFLSISFFVLVGLSLVCFISDYIRRVKC